MRGGGLWTLRTGPQLICFFLNGLPLGEIYVKGELKKLDFIGDMSLALPLPYPYSL